MPDVYATISEQDQQIQERLAEVLNMRAADPQQRRMLESYLTGIDFPKDARVLDVGCGPGPVTRTLARWPGIAEVVGVDPSPVFIANAREKGMEMANLTFEEGDARSLPFEDDEFDVVVFHTVLCHIPGCEAALSEALRVIKPSGWLAAFDGDYATTTLAAGDHDPLQACADAAIAALVHDRWLVRRLPSMVRTAGFEITDFRSHGFAEVSEPGYMMSIVERGADALSADGLIGPDLAGALKAEARRRDEQGVFFGHIAYASLIARKPEA